MKAYLMHPDRDVELEPELPVNAAALVQDLELDTVLDAMARGDAYLRERAENAILAGLTDPGEILYRQRILADCIAHPAIVRQLYDLAVEGVETKQRSRFLWFRDTPEAVLQKSLAILELLADVLARLRRLTDEHAAAFASDGFTRLFATLQRELEDDYLATVDHHLRELRFRRGTLVSAELGRGNRSTRFVLRKRNDQSLLGRLTPGRPASHSFTIPTRDEHGLRALAELRERGIAVAAEALGQSTDHVLAFFMMLRAELGFYVGCLNLHEQLVARGGAISFPVPLAEATEAFSARGLYDAALVFHLGSQVIGNDVDADGKRLVLITGANQGGKSTFLRSVGTARLLMQAGMFVPAASFSAAVCRGVFTHFKREEDATMTSGKLDEELSRMSEIADLIGPHCLLLCNESFSSTNEREGSEIARQLVRALVEAGVDVFFVTHLFDLADSLHRQRLEEALFLRAERRPDGRRTFRILPGEPLPTSYGVDSFRRIFGAEGEARVEEAAG
jgi:DNA mismatch repair ATPase MutS